jgi:hypothetical protein
MDKEEYYKRIERINNRFKTDRVSADEEYQLVCQKNYLSTKYIEHLEQQCKKQKELIDRILNETKETRDILNNNRDDNILSKSCLLSYLEIVEDLLKEVSE